MTTKNEDTKSATAAPSHDDGMVKVDRQELDKLLRRVADLEAAPRNAVSAGDSLEVQVLRKRVSELEQVRNDADSPVTRVIARTCNSCGRSLTDKEQVCPSHPSEHVNHLGNSINPETMLRQQVIVRQTRA